MRRSSVLFAVCVVALFGLLAVGGAAFGTVAQEATPAPEEFELPEGVGFEFLAFAPADLLPPAPTDVVLARFSLDPGASFSIEEDDPALALAYVESGAFTVEMQGPMTVLRAAGEGTPPPEEGETIPAGTEFTLAAGESAIFPPNVAGSVRNDGTQPAVALLVIVEPAADEAGTPDATPA